MGSIPSIYDTDQQIIVRLRTREPGAFEWLYDTYAATLLGAIGIMLGREDRNMAEEILVKTFTSAWKHILEYDPAEESLLAWMLKTARKKVAISLQAEIPEPVNSVHMERTAEQVADMVLERVYIKGYTIAETAKQLMITEDTVRTTLISAVRKLKKGRQHE